MKDNRFTIIIQPDFGKADKKINTVRSCIVQKRLFYFLGISLVLLIIFGVSGSWSIRDNIVIKKRISSIKLSLERLNNINAQVNSISKEELIIREFLGIEAWGNNFDINERMGKGGAKWDEDSLRPTLNAKNELMKAEEKIPLHIRVLNLKEDIHELHTVLARMTETLKARPTIMPVKASALWISSGFGWRKNPFTGLKQFHEGLDISGNRGTPIIVTSDGIIKKVGYNRFLGNYIVVIHDERFSTRYGHLLKSEVKKAAGVKRGQVIGYMGTSGMSTGYHLHYEVIDNEKKVNPYYFILNRKEISFVASN